MSLKTVWQTKPELWWATLRAVLLSMVALLAYQSVSGAHPGIPYTDEYVPWPANERLFVLCTAGLSVLALSILAAVWIWPAANRARLFLGLLVDAVITIGLCFAAVGYLLACGYLILVAAFYIRLRRDDVRRGPIHQ